MGKSLAMLGKFDEAKPHLEKALSFAEDDWTSANYKEMGITANWLAYIAFNQRDKDALLMYSEKAIKMIDNPEPHTYRGMALLWFGRKKGAEREKKRVTERSVH